MKSIYVFPKQVQRSLRRSTQQLFFPSTTLTAMVLRFPRFSRVPDDQLFLRGDVVDIVGGKYKHLREGRVMSTTAKKVYLATSSQGVIFINKTSVRIRLPILPTPDSDTLDALLSRCPDLRDGLDDLCRELLRLGFDSSDSPIQGMLDSSFQRGRFFLSSHPST
jgi:hypothetical protein